MTKNDILIKREQDPLQNIEWHLSLEGRISNSLFRNIWHYATVTRQMSDFLRLLDPERMSNNAEDYRIKRDNTSLPLQSRIHWHNKIVSLYESALGLTLNLTPEDEKILNLPISELKELLLQIRDKYEIMSYRNNLLNKNNTI